MTSLDRDLQKFTRYSRYYLSMTDLDNKGVRTCLRRGWLQIYLAIGGFPVLGLTEEGYAEIKRRGLKCDFALDRAP